MYRKIYKELNNRFFEGELRDPIFLMGRHNQSIGGYFIPAAWTNSRDAEDKLGEICVNVNLLQREKMGDLVMVIFHEMIHQYQFQINPGRAKGIHDSDFIDFGNSVGLKTEVQDVETRVATGAIVPGSALANFVTDYMAAVAATDFIPATPDKSIVIDEQAAQPMPPDRTDPGGQPGGDQGEDNGKGDEGADGQPGGDGQQGGNGEEAPGGTGKNQGRGTPTPSNKRQGEAKTGQETSTGHAGASPDMNRNYICPACGSRVIGKAGLSIQCLKHAQRMIECAA